MSISSIKEQQKAQKGSWILIYESKQTKKLLSGTISAIEQLDGTYCHVVFFEDQIKVLIPAKLKGGYEPQDEKGMRNLMFAMIGANIDFVVEEIDRENELVIGNRAKALEIKKKNISRLEENMRVPCNVIAVGRGSVTVEVSGFELRLRHWDVTWYYETDMRNVASVGNQLDCIITKVDPEENVLAVSIKLATPDPYANISKRYKQDSIAMAVVSLINEKFVYVRLPSGVDARCPHPGWPSQQLKAGDKVQVRIRGINEEKRHIVALINRLIERA